MYRTERVVIVSVLLAAGVGIIGALGRGIGVSDPLNFAPLTWLLAAVLVMIAVVGTRWVTNFATDDAIAAPRLPFLPAGIDIVLPGLLALGFSVFVLIFDDTALQAAVVILAGFSFGAVYWSLVHGLRTSSSNFALSQTVLNVVAHLTAFLVLSVIYGLKLPSIEGAMAVGVISALLLYELLTRDAAWHGALGQGSLPRKVPSGLFAAGGGLIMAELAWGLNYWAALSTLVGGAFLLLAFYVIHGLVSGYVNLRLNRQLLIEFGTVAVIGLAVIFGTAFFS